MIITCQNCQTNYDIEATALAGGKTVSCHNCGNTWHQNPVQTPPPVAMQPVYPQQVPFAQPPQPVPAPVPAPEPAPAPAPEAAPEPMPEPEPVSDIEADAAARAEAAIMAEAEDAAVQETGPGDDSGEGSEEGADVDAADDNGAGEDALTTEQLDEMFGEDTEGGAFDSLASPTEATDDDEEGGGEADGDADGELDLDAIPEPDPIPQVFSADDDDDFEDSAKKGGKGKIIAIAVATVIFIALGAGAFFGRSLIVEMYPPAADLYAMLNLGGEDLGVGLDIRNVKSLREVENGIDVLVVQGEIANVSDEEHMVPMIRVVLFDSSGEEIQSTTAAPLKNRLQAGAMIAFSAKLPEPSALARRLEVTFMEPKKKGD